MLPVTGISLASLALFFKAEGLGQNIIPSVIYPQPAVRFKADIGIVFLFFSRTVFAFRAAFSLRFLRLFPAVNPDIQSVFIHHSQTKAVIVKDKAPLIDLFFHGSGIIQKILFTSIGRNAVMLLNHIIVIIAAVISGHDFINHLNLSDPVVQVRDRRLHLTDDLRRQVAPGNCFTVRSDGHLPKIIADAIRCRRQIFGNPGSGCFFKCCLMKIHGKLELVIGH